MRSMRYDTGALASAPVSGLHGPGLIGPDVRPGDEAKLFRVVVVTLQAWGQQRVDAMRSAIVFGLEPVFASLTAWFLLGESLGWAGVGGAALIVTALVVSQLQPASGATTPAAQPEKA